MAWRKTPEEKKEIRANNNASYLARKTALDAADIKTAYQGHEEDMADHQGAYENDNWKMGFGLFFAAIGAGGVFEEGVDLARGVPEETTETVQEPESGMKFEFNIDLDNMGGALIFAFAGAALIASGIKGKNAIKNHIQKRVSSGPKEPEAAAPKTPAVS